MTKRNLDFDYRDLRMMGVDGSSHLGQIVYGPLHASPFSAKLVQKEDGGMDIQVTMPERLAQDIVMGLKLLEMERARQTILLGDKL
jgi:hypothetical protein